MGRGFGEGRFCKNALPRNSLLDSRRFRQPAFRRLISSVIVAQGLTKVSLKYDKPVIFGVLTPNDQQQALDRSGGKYGNKGDEAAITAIKIVAL